MEDIDTTDYEAPGVVEQRVEPYSQPAVSRGEALTLASLALTDAATIIEGKYVLTGIVTALIAVDGLWLILRERRAY